MIHRENDLAFGRYGCNAKYHVGRSKTMKALFNRGCALAFGRHVCDAERHVGGSET